MRSVAVLVVIVGVGGGCRTRLADGGDAGGGGDGDAGAGQGFMRWRVGWDREDLVIDLAASYVSWRHPPGSRELTAHYHIVGAEPRSFHVVGIHSFDPEGRCFHRFGQFSQRDGCWFSITRQNVFAPVAESFDATMLSVDDAGNGDLDFTWTDIAPDTYHLAFHLRHAASAANCPCPVTHQAPGPFASTVVLTIP